MATQILTWWLLIQLIGLLALPLTMFTFRALPDQGYAFSKALGLLLTGYGAWLLAMLGLAPFGAPLLVGCALLVGVVGVLTLKPTTADRRPTTDARASVFGYRSAVLSRYLRENWRRIAAYEVLFLAMLVFMALVRSYNPQPWGTERPMDYAFFNAISRSASFPPHDPWLAGYSINYYYFGYLLMASMTLLSGLESSVAYNLSLALIFALTALGVAGIVRNLVALTKDEGRRTKDEAQNSLAPSPLHPFTPSLGPWLAVLTSVVLVLFAANQGGTLQIVSGTDKVLELSGNDMVRAVVNGVQRRTSLELVAPYKAWGDAEETRTLKPTDKWQDFNWWNPSRALWDRSRNPDDPTKYYAITEFPLFSFWLGDMHPHVMVLPFTLLALALALQTLARPAAPPFAQSKRGWLELVITGIILGSLYVINSWDFPTYLLLFAGALLLLFARLGAPPSPLYPLTPSPPRILWSLYAQQLAMVVMAALVLFAPFHLTFRSLVGGKEPLVNLPIIGGLSRTIGLVTWDKTALHTFLIIFGLFLVPLVGYLIGQARGARVPSWLLWVTLGALVLGAVTSFPLVALLPLALVAILAALNRSEEPAMAFVLWAFALVCLVCLGTELIYIRDVFESRMNTIFKFYYQAWLIWGTLAGYALWSGVRGQGSGVRGQGSAVDDHDGGRWVVDAEPESVQLSPAASSVVGRRSSVVVITLFVSLLIGALVYPWLTVGRAFRNDTRQGLVGKTPRENTPAGVASIEWLRANTNGTDVLIEAVGGDYNGDGGGGVAASTGLPSVINWVGHQQQWRGGDPKTLALLEPRANDVRTIFDTTDINQARTLLDQYKVKYVYIGALERTNYPAEGLAKFAQLGTPVFQQDEVVIYRVG